MKLQSSEPMSIKTTSRIYLIQIIRFGRIVITKEILYTPPLNISNDGVAITSLDKAEVFVLLLEKKYHLNKNLVNPEPLTFLEEEASAFIRTADIFDVDPISAPEINIDIYKLKPNKGLGPDLISNRMIKNIPFKFVFYLT